MADDIILASQRLLFLGTSDADKQLICILDHGKSESASTINADSMCGPRSIPGTFDGSMNVNGQIVEAVSAGKTSYKQLHDWFAARQSLFYLIARATPEVDQIEERGSCFITAIGTSDGKDAESKFTLTLQIDGVNTVTIYGRDITLATVSVASGNIGQGDENKVYVVSVDAENSFVIDSATIVLNGTFDNNDITNVKLYWNTSNTLAAATLLATDTTGLTSGGSINLGSAITVPAAATHLLVAVTLDAAATLSGTIIPAAPVFVIDESAYQVTDNILGAGGTQIIIA